MKGKKSATITKHIKDFLKNKKIEINFCKIDKKGLLWFYLISV